MDLAERVKYAEMKARHQKLFRPWYKKWWGILALIIIGLILIFLIRSAFYVYNEIKRINAEQTKISLKDQRQEYEKLIRGQGGYMLGTTNPKITVIEFTDFACPFCKDAAPEIRKLMEQYKNNIQLIVRDYPIHDNSIDLAIAARCAGEQGKYWEAYDSLFSNQDNLTDTGDALHANLLAWAEFLKLDAAKFDTCFTERRYLDLIKKDYNDGNSLQIKGTPTWFVNNHPITGAYSEDKFKELFDGLLQQLQ